MPKRKRAGSQRTTENPRARRRWLIVLVAIVAVGAVIAAYRWSPLRHDRSRGEKDEASSVRNVLAANDPTPDPETDEAILETHQQLADDMISTAERVLARFPEDPLSYDLLGRVYMFLGKSAKAGEEWQRCLDLEPHRPDALHGLAQIAIKSGDDAAAEQLLRQAFATDPRYPQVAGQLADVLMRRQQVKEAAAVLERYLQQVPTSTEYLMQLAQIQQQLGEFEEARSNFQRVIEQRPESSEAYLGLGTVLMRLGRRDEAREHLEKSRELRSQKPPTASKSKMTPEVFDVTMTRVNHASATVYAAKVYQAHGELPEAARLCRRAARVDPKNLPSRLLLMRLYEQMNRLPDAVRVCEETVAADPENPDLLWRLGVLNAQAGFLDAAESALQEVIRLAPDQARGYAGLAEVYLESRRHQEESLRLIREAIRLDPSALHYVLLGRIYVQAGNIAAARKALREALEREPNNVAFRQLYNQLPPVPPAD